jgi:hypothetical protein
MKTAIPFASLMLTSCIFTACLHTQIQRQASAGDNLGFEIAEQGLPYNWIMYKPPYCNHNISLDTLRPKEGKQSLHFDISTCTEQHHVNFTGFTNEFMELTQGGGAYRISFWLRNEGAQVRAKLSGVRAKGEGAQAVIIEENSTLAEWKQFQTEVTIDADMWLRFELQVRGEGSCWIDDVKIEKIN